MLSFYNFKLCLAQSIVIIDSYFEKRFYYCIYALFINFSMINQRLTNITALIIMPGLTYYKVNLDRVVQITKNHHKNIKTCVKYFSIISNQRLTIRLTNKFMRSIKFVCSIRVNRWFACNYWFFTNKIVWFSKLALNQMSYNDFFDNYDSGISVF